MQIYIHIPFCMKKCAYCDFLSAPYDRNIRAKYADAICREIEYYGSRMDEPVETVFIGGGTPSWLELPWMEKILTALFQSFSIERNAEFSIEVNPGTVTKDAMAAYVTWGIKRLSIGLQSANADELALLGRVHTYEQFLKTYEIARFAGIKNINIDIMTGLPGQTESKLRHTLDQVLLLRPEHISAYSLMIEEGTPFFDLYAEDAKRQARGEKTVYLPDEEEVCALTDLCEAKLASHGYLQYEFSNFAKKGYECRHNMGYWQRRPYLGLGLGAASFYGHARYENQRDIYRYMDDPMDRKESLLSKQDEMAEFMYLGLRVTAGILRQEFEECFEVPISEVYGGQLASLMEKELLAEENGRIFLTKHGREISNAVLAEFLPDEE